MIAGSGGKQGRRIVIGMVVAVLVYVALILVAGLDEVIRGAGLLSAGNWILLLGLTLLHFALRFWRWTLYLTHLGRSVPPVRNLLIYMSGFALTTTPGKVGETWRSIYLQPHGIPYSETMACFFAERYADLVVIMLLSLLVVGQFGSALWPLVLGCLLLLGLLLGLRHPRLPDVLERLQRRTRSTPLTAVLKGLKQLLRAASRLLGLRSIGSGTLIGLLAWGAQGLILHMVLMLMGAPVPPAVAVGIYALGLLAGALSFLPGGLGSTEAVMVLSLVALGVDAATAAAATLVCRVATLWFAVLLGLLAVFALQLSRPAQNPVDAD